jgi:hypothetical protein
MANEHRSDLAEYDESCTRRCTSTAFEGIPQADLEGARGGGGVGARAQPRRHEVREYVLDKVKRGGTAMRAQSLKMCAYKQRYLDGSGTRPQSARDSASAWARRQKEPNKYTHRPGSVATSKYARHHTAGPRKKYGRHMSTTSTLREATLEQDLERQPRRPQSRYPAPMGMIATRRGR